MVLSVLRGFCRIPLAPVAQVIEASSVTDGKADGLDCGVTWPRLHKH